MLTFDLLKILSLSVNSCHLIGGLLFYFNPASRRLVISRSKVKWGLVSFQLTFLALFLFIVLDRILLSIRIHDSFCTIIMTLALIAIAGSTFYAVIWLYQSEELVRVLNRYISYWIHFAEKYSIHPGILEGRMPRNKGSRHGGEGLERILRVMTVVIAVQPFFAQLCAYIIFLQPERQIYITTLIPLNLLAPYSVQVVWVLGIPVFVVILLAWSIVYTGFTLLVIYSFETTFILKELNPASVINARQRSGYTYARLRTTRTLLNEYRCQQLLQDEFNHMTRFGVPSFFVMIMVLNIVCNISIVLYASELHVGAFMLGAMALLCMFWQTVIYNQFGKIEKLSISYIKAWRTSGYLRKVAPKEAVILKKVVRSFRPMHLNVGQWGYIKEITSLNVSGKILMYTSKLLLTLQKS